MLCCWIITLFKLAHHFWSLLSSRAIHLKLDRHLLQYDMLNQVCTNYIFVWVLSATNKFYQNFAIHKCGLRQKGRSTIWNFFLVANWDIVPKVIWNSLDASWASSSTIIQPHTCKKACGLFVLFWLLQFSIQRNLQIHIEAPSIFTSNRLTINLEIWKLCPCKLLPIGVKGPAFHSWYVFKPFSMLNSFVTYL